MAILHPLSSIFYPLPGANMLGELKLVEPVVVAVLRQQLLVCHPRRHAPCTLANPVDVTDGREPVGDHDRCAPF